MSGHRRQYSDPFFCRPSLRLSISAIGILLDVLMLMLMPGECVLSLKSFGSSSVNLVRLMLFVCCLHCQLLERKQPKQLASTKEHIKHKGTKSGQSIDWLKLSLFHVLFSACVPHSLWFDAHLDKYHKTSTHDIKCRCRTAIVSSAIANNCDCRTICVLAANLFVFMVFHQQFTLFQRLSLSLDRLALFEFWLVLLCFCLFANIFKLMSGAILSIPTILILFVILLQQTCHFFVVKINLLNVT